MNVRITTTAVVNGEEQPPTESTFQATDLPPWVGHLLEDATRIEVTYGNDGRVVAYEVAQE